MYSRNTAGDREEALGLSTEDHGEASQRNMPRLANAGNNLLPTYIDVNFVIYESSNI